MEIIVAQTRIYGHDIKRNFENMKKIIEKQSSQSMIIFPDLALIGSAGFLLLNKEENQEYLGRYHEKLVKLSQNKVIVWGSVENSMRTIFVAYNGLVQRVIKQELNQDSYFQEALHYKTAPQIDNTVTLEGKEYSFSFEGDMKRKESSINIILGNSFWHKGIAKKRMDSINDYENPVIYINAVGTQNLSKSIFVYDGGSFYKEKNEVRQIGKLFQEHVVTVTDFHHNYEGTFQMKTIMEALITLLRQFDEEVLSFKPNWIIGLSGGLDSSVSYALLNMALGNDRVIPVTMPSKYNRDISKNNATKLADNFQTELLTVPVEGLALETVKALADISSDVSKGLAYENIQARLRGHILMSVSSVKNGVVINNGNKVESALGYATMYGDAIGALSPLADLTKVEVGLLAQEINDFYKKEMIPQNLIPTLHNNYIEWDFAPSAELAQDQFDPMKWGYHDLLIEYLMRTSVTKILESYYDGSIYDLGIGRYLKVYGLDEPHAFIEDLEWVIRQLNNAAFKRLQMPPVAVLSDISFGNGYLENQQTHFETEQYQQLKLKILQQ